MASVFKANTTGAVAIAASTTIPAGIHYALISATVHFSAGPTTGGTLTIKLNANAGAAYDTTIYSVDPSTGSVTNLVYQPTYPLIFEPGDVIETAYANADGRTYGLQLTFQQVF